MMNRFLNRLCQNSAERERYNRSLSALYLRLYQRNSRRYT